MRCRLFDQVKKLVGNERDVIVLVGNERDVIVLGDGELDGTDWLTAIEQTDWLTAIEQTGWLTAIEQTGWQYVCRTAKNACLYEAGNAFCGAD